MNQTKETKILMGLIFAIILIIFLANSLFIVQQTQQAIVLQFGRPIQFSDGDKQVQFIHEPGIKFKLPFIQKVLFFDKRLLNFEASDKEVLDLEKKALNVSAFAKYKITNPLIFYQKVTDEQGINSRLNQIFEASLRDAIGSVPLREMLTDKRKFIMQQIRDNVSIKAEDFGIKIVDVRIVSADLPGANSESIYKRMYADRDKEAREYRAQGEEEAKVIRAQADKQVKILIAEANKKAKIIRGDADAEATKIYANSYEKDPEFFSFYRSLEAYKKTFDKNNTKFILSEDNEFLKYLESGAN